MKKPRNFITLILMASSIGLLLVLQFLWLRSSYHRAMDDLHKETNHLFRNTVLAMRDSLLERSIERMPGDTASERHFRFHSVDSSRVRTMPDSLFEKFSRKEKVSRIQILVTPNDGDSLDELVKPLASRFYNYRGEGNFIMRLGPDSLAIDSLSRDFKTALSRAGIDLPFEVIHLKHGERLPFQQGIFISEQVRINPVNRYAASFSGVSHLVLKEIIPQILFSFFLTALTGGAFFMMYQSVVKQQRLTDLKNDFISNVTHELKTPITTVKVALEALRDFKGLDNPRLTREYLDIAQSEMNRLTILTDKVLKTAIFEKNGVTFQPEIVEIDKMIEQILASMKIIFEKSGVKINFRKEGENLRLRGSADHLTNVIYNLLDNALKYSTVDPQIDILLRDEGQNMVIAVRDNGPGIPAEYHKRIFEKFFRVPSGDIHNVKGYGLGLSYVHSVVRGHKGTIEVESTGQGSTFVITIPKG